MTILEKAESVLRIENFETGREFSFGKSYSDLYAFRKGRNFIFPQRDFFFLHDIERRRIDAAGAARLHEEARVFVNSMFKLPRALRFTVPNIASVFFSENFIPEEIKILACRNTRSVIGGEIQQIFAAEFGTGKYWSQGRNTVTAVNDGIRISGQFGKIDPQNRADSIVRRLISC